MDRVKKLKWILILRIIRQKDKKKIQLDIQEMEKERGETQIARYEIKMISIA